MCGTKCCGPTQGCDGNWCCDPKCDGKTCGSDGCDGSCGSCASGEVCLGAGKCVLETVEVPAGKFWMGCNEAVEGPCNLSEYPYHEVYLDAFAIDTTEVTKQAYKTCVDAGTCVPTGDTWSEEDAFVPAQKVDWYAAEKYCKSWAGKRLCTEAEWEKAARGTDGQDYPWGNSAATCSLAVIDLGGSSAATGCGTGGPMGVGSIPAGASPYGALDMGGNVQEWVADWLSWEYYASSPASNPKGPSSGTSRVMRGGSYAHGSWFLRASMRFGEAPGDADPRFGFRCCKSLD